MRVTRRQFVRSTLVTSLAFSGLQRLWGLEPMAAADTVDLPTDFGPLQPDAAGLVDLPHGFTYRVLSRRGERMDDGLFVPGMHDGMAAFPGPDGLTILIRNHEVTPDHPAWSAFGPDGHLLKKIPRDKLYDTGQGYAPGPGGTTTLVVDARTGELKRHFLSLAGTMRNCAGGPTPWGSWLSCEEDVRRAGTSSTAGTDRWLERDHGYVFEVPATAEPGLADPIPLKAMGRFFHEAVAVDPDTSIVYLTEDRGDGLLYRFIPDTPGKLAQGGRLQALAVVDQPSLDTRNHSDEPTVAVGEALAVRWIDLDEVEAPRDDLRHRGFAAGAARFSRGEGIWWGDGEAYFTCTHGGRLGKGQVWRYRPSPAEGTAEEAGQPGRLELFSEPNDPEVMDMVDNVTVAPWGDLILCEDGSDDQHVLGLTPQGKIYKLARNARSSGEFAGACFAPDGSTLFINLQGEGVTLAVTGPWPTA